MNNPDNERDLGRDRTRRFMTPEQEEELRKRIYSYNGLLAVGIRYTWAQIKVLPSLDFGITSHVSSFGRKWLQSLQDARINGYMNIPDELLLLVVPGLIFGITNTILNIKKPILKKISGFKRDL